MFLSTCFITYDLAATAWAFSASSSNSTGISPATTPTIYSSIGTFSIVLVFSLYTLIILLLEKLKVISSSLIKRVTII